MLGLGTRSWRLVFPPALLVLLVDMILLDLLFVSLSGCKTGSGTQDQPLLDPVKVTDLRPGCYCEIDMTVPPLSPKGSIHSFNGTVQEVNQEEVVMVNVLEQSNIDYNTSKPRPLTARKRDLVHVPLTGVDTIWGRPPADSNTSVKPPPAAPGGLPPDPGAPPAPPAGPARFAAPPTAGGFNP
jgi:hypothetical protein